VDRATVGHEDWLGARPPDRIDGDGLTLIRWRVEDADALLQAIDESLPELARWLPWARGGYGRDEARSFLDDVDLAWREGRGFAYGIRDAAGALLGGIGLMDRVGRPALEIGYWVRTSRTRQGVARRATAALIGAVRRLGAVEAVEIHHDVENVASGRIPATFGFVRWRDYDERDDAGDHVIAVWRLDLRERSHGQRVADGEGRRER
jgi:RimJ/RimL family protein N-acetyltransferase